MALARYKNSVNGLTKLFMVLLRIAIGWHIGYEGDTKLQSHWRDEKPFSAEMYLRNSTGPFREHFVSIVEDFHGLDKLDVEKLTQAWQQSLDKFAQHYGFADEQKQEAQKTLDELKERLGESVVVLASAAGGSVQMVAMATPGAVARGVSAREVVRNAATIVGGGGGGSERMAQAGGKDPSRLEEALRAAKAGILQHLEGEKARQV